MNMLKALGATPPVYAHLPMILGPDGAKLSKRHGAVDIREYREQGYLPAAMLNYLARLGWSHGDQEVFAIDELTTLFDIDDVNQSASAFNPEKLIWLNHQHVMAANPSSLADDLRHYQRSMGLDPDAGPDAEQVILAYRERARTLVEMAAQSRYCYDDFDEIEPKSAKKHLRPVILEPMKALTERLAGLSHWGEAQIKEAIETTAEEYDLNLGKLGQPLRVAVTGGPVSPPIDTTVWLVGQERTITRLKKAIELIEERASNAA
jgi:glutamyl-tRNA synthetase